MKMIKCQRKLGLCWVDWSDGPLGKQTRYLGLSGSIVVASLLLNLFN